MTILQYSHLVALRSINKHVIMETNTRIKCKAKRYRDRTRWTARNYGTLAMKFRNLCLPRMCLVKVGTGRLRSEIAFVCFKTVSTCGSCTPIIVCVFILERVEFRYRWLEVCVYNFGLYFCKVWSFRHNFHETMCLFRLVFLNLYVIFSSSDFVIIRDAN